MRRFGHKPEQILSKRIHYGLINHNAGGTKVKTYFAINRYDRADIGYFVSTLNLTEGAMVSCNNTNGIFVIIGYTNDNVIKFGKKLDPAFIQDAECLNSWDCEWKFFCPQKISTIIQLLEVYKTAITTSKLVTCCLVG